MIEFAALHAALLDLGLEDWIPLPEAVLTPTENRATSARWVLGLIHASSTLELRQ